MTPESPPPEVSEDRRAEIIAVLKDALKIRIRTSEMYNGGMGDGPAYTTCYSVKLLLDDEVISEDWP